MFLNFIKDLFAKAQSQSDSSQPQNTAPTVSLKHIQVSETEISPFLATPALLDQPHPETTAYFVTDVATFAAFDPTSLDYLKDDEGWWISFDRKKLKEVEEGKITLLSLGCDGGYRFRFTTQDALSQLEKDYCVNVIEGLGIKVENNQLYLGDAVCLPDYGHGVEMSNLKSGLLVEMPNGVYDLKIYAINAMKLDDLDTGTRAKLLDDMVDFVIILGQRKTPFKSVKSLMMGLDKSRFVFKSTGRTERHKVTQGRIVKARAITTGKNPETGKHNLKLRETDYSYDFPWPHNYIVLMEDWTGIEWNDHISVEIIKISRKDKTVHVRFKEKLEKIDFEKYDKEAKSALDRAMETLKKM